MAEETDEEYRQYQENIETHRDEVNANEFPRTGFNTDKVDADLSRAMLESDSRIAAAIIEDALQKTRIRQLATVVVAKAKAWREADQQTDEEEYILRCDALREAVDALNAAEK